MLIHSNFRDFYDSALASGVDKRVVYSRLQRQVSVCTGHSSYHSWRQVDGRRTYYIVFYVGFCGKWYVGYAEGGEYNLTDARWKLDKDKIWYGQDAAEKIYPEKSVAPWIHANRSSMLARHGEVYIEPFVKAESPAILVLPKKVIINPNLGNIHFQKVIDPYSAFQEIEMFLTNELAKQVDPAPLSDKDRLKAHGFDEKWSFRRDTPPKRKQKKK